MTTGTYDRYGLTSNPFRDLASESISDIEIYHVRTRIDEGLASIKDEVLEKENRALVALVGPLGAGKTQRLLLAAFEARERKAFTVFFEVVPRTVDVLKGLAQEIQKSSTLGGFAKAFASPAWYRDVGALLKLKEPGYDPSKAGKAIARALNENAPAFLLLNDVHNLSSTAEAVAFARALQEIADSIQPGVLVMFGCYPSYLQALAKAHPALGSRINRTFVLPGLTDEEAGLLLAKKLLAKRLVEELDPLFPFERDAIGVLNGAVGGNPRRLLEVADRVLEYAVEHRAYRIDAEVVEAALATPATAQAIASSSAAPPRPVSSGAPAEPRVPRPVHPGGPAVAKDVR
ncbi:MAG: ATP-binding protein [Thermoplasmata archaeon]|nr:ATP-binding protein [Thermoplasmata archaeon]